MSIKIKNKKKIVINILVTIFVFICSVALFSATWYSSVYGNIGFESIIYTLTTSMKGVQSGLVTDWLVKGFLPACLVTVLIFVVFLLIPFKLKNTNRVLKITSVSLALIVSVSLFFVASEETKATDWIKYKMQKTDIYEKEYVSSDKVKITFPEQKQNLIYIYLESMETSYFLKDQGGGNKDNAIPHLYELAKENTNFSQNNGVGGGRDIFGATLTIGAMVSQTSATPLVGSLCLVEKIKQGENYEIAKGAVTITDILRDNNYYQVFMVGSDSKYGERYNFYTSHGVNKVYDIYTAYKDKIVSENYWQWWGMEDKYLFEYAKSKLNQLSASDKPFAFTLLTADTHHIDGFKCSECQSDFSEQYSNVLSCSSKQVFEFVNWIKQQPFYENTTIVITGDHCTMDNKYIINNIEKGYQRRLYNCFINPVCDDNFSKNRQFVSFDMLPTTLAAIGAEIEGERLGFGTNLFSGEKTLTEKMGYEKLNVELAKYSEYYVDKIIKAN